MIYSIKLKNVILWGLCAILVFVFCFVAIKGAILGVSFTMPNSKYLVVIDAGHGARDGGSVGKFTGVLEKDLNLEYAKNLATQFNKMGISCVLTRSDDSALYEEDANNLKRSEMKRRKEVIEMTNPNLVISIHMDSFALSSTSGAQAFYKKDSESGKILASKIQKQLSCNFENAKKTEKVGDYYIVNCTDVPSVLVECGFLSNKEEELNLQDKNFQDKMCYSIMCGALDFLNYSF